MKIEFENATNDIISVEIIRKLADFEDVIIFGAGQSGEWVYNLLCKNAIHPKCYCDNYQAKWGMIRNGIKVMSFEEAMKKYPKAAICVASMWSEEIFKQIEKYDKYALKRTWDLLTTMAWETSNFNYQSNEPQFILDNINRFEWLYQHLSDDISKKTLEGLLNYRLTRKKFFLKNIISDEITYMDNKLIPAELVDIITKKIIIDGGAFDGDTVEEFIRNWGGKNILNIHCYEAEKNNCLIIREKQDSFKPHKVYVHQSALWSENKVSVKFVGNTLSGKVDLGEKDDKNGICTESIDEFNYENVGFIKLDIEGAEREALKGAENTLRRCRPILAVCAYHLQDDLLVLAEYIWSLHCGYRLILRHYMYSSGDTVLYALPEECLG